MPTFPPLAALLRHPFVRLLRPAQWIKNVVLFAPLFFSLWNAADSAAGRTPALPLGRATFAFLCFCLLSSGIYVFNDLVDAPRDRLHPRKRLRPVASGEVSFANASAIAALLPHLALALSLFCGKRTTVIFIGYFLLQILYTLLLKHLPVLDVIAIASGFVLRVAAGGAACSVPLSPWILLCTFFLALFLALCKRRQEKSELAGSPSSAARPSLRHIPLRLLDTLVFLSAAAALLCYAAYTQAPATVRNFGTRGLALTLPFVGLGFARYLVLLHRTDETERPERVLLTDLPLLADLLLFGLSVAAVFLLRDSLPW